MSASKRCAPPLRSHEISDDILNIILLQVPVKDLLRCKAVCKSWCSLISTSTFVNSQFNLAITTPGADETFIVRNNNDASLLLLHLNGPFPLVTDLKYPYSEGDFSSVPDTIIVGSARGIVCVYVLETFNRLKCVTDGYLWNPVTNRSKVIPPFKCYNDRLSVTFFFGFDPISNDFKVVRYFSDYDIELYSANTNAWRKVGPKPKGIYRGLYNVCVNGFVCWTDFNGEGIVAFDLNKEMFNCNTIMFPDGLSNNTSSYLEITDFNGSVAIMKDNRSDGKVKLWKLDNVECLGGSGGGVALWSQILSIDKTDLPKGFVHSYFNSGNLLIFKGYVWFSYDSRKKEAKEVPIRFSDLPGNMFKFTESLVSIPGSRPVEWNAHEDDK